MRTSAARGSGKPRAAAARRRLRGLHRTSAAWDSERHSPAAHMSGSDRSRADGLHRTCASSSPPPGGGCGLPTAARSIPHSGRSLRSVRIHRTADLQQGEAPARRTCVRLATTCDDIEAAPMQNPVLIGAARRSLTESELPRQPAVQERLSFAARMPAYSAAAAFAAAAGIESSCTIRSSGATSPSSSATMRSRT